MRTDGESYYRTRALQEQVAARNATSEAARRCHAQLTTMYRFRVATLASRDRPVARGAENDAPESLLGGRAQRCRVSGSRGSSLSVSCEP